MSKGKLEKRWLLLVASACLLFLLGACAEEIDTNPNPDLETCAGGDDVCPASCHANNDSDCPAVCGNDQVEWPETCDGNCPTTCESGFACSVDSMEGSAETCDVLCLHHNLQDCTDGDGCCPGGCDQLQDNDCSASCGNGATEDGETCDGDCPEVCEDDDACTENELTGSAESCSAICSFPPIDVCWDDDGCCPDGCSALSDNDCAVDCAPGACPTTLTDIVLCEDPVCSLPDPATYTDQGGEIYGEPALDHRLFQRREEVAAGETIITDVQAMLAFEAQPTLSGYTWVGSSCDFDFVLECYVLFAKFEPYTPGSQQSAIVNSSYCIKHDLADAWCPGPDAIDPPSTVYRPTPLEEPICIGFDFEPNCHDLFVEKKQLE